MKEFLKKLKTRFDDPHGKEFGKLGLSPYVDPEKRFLHLRKGWWHSYPIGFYGDTPYSLRIFPSKKFNLWPVVENYALNSMWTISPNLALFPVLKKSIILKKKAAFKVYAKNPTELEKVISDFEEIIGQATKIDFLLDFLSNEENIPRGSEDALDIYLLFWFTLDPSPGHGILRDIIEESKKNPNWAPKSIRQKDLGHWETRIQNSLGTISRNAVLGGLPDEHNLASKWSSFCQPHGYDTTSVFLSHYPEFQYTAESNLKTSIYELKGLGLGKDNFQWLPNEIKSHPLYAALLSLYGNYQDYIGVQHFEAAVLFDQELNDPIQCWNALASAAYWSGLNREETMLPAWKAAIQLCEINEWDDAHWALVDNWNFYHNFKKQNNLP